MSNLYMTLHQTFRFEAAHALTHIPQKHPCATIHGHSWKLTLSLRALVQPYTWIMDFTEITAIVEPLLKKIDHSFLNNVLPRQYGSPTCENLLLWLWNELFPYLPNLSKLSLYETEDCGCDYEGKTTNNLNLGGEE